MITRVINNTQLHASESVTEGHPDKICDQIAAEILDQAIIASKPTGIRPRVAMEVSAKGNDHGGTLLLFGEVTLPKGITLDYDAIARRTLKTIGYTDPTCGFHANMEEIIIRITGQSSDIRHGVSRKRTGAGDQGIMFGGAVDETPECMPAPVAIAHAITDTYTNLRRKTHTFLRPDAKAQVVMSYKHGTPKSIYNIIMAVSHDPHVTSGGLRTEMINHVISPVLTHYGYPLPDAAHIIINGAGPWVIYGPLADAGTTNRKIIVDSYGGAFPHGGGGFNGKDPTKVDLAGAVGARFVAKRLVAEHLAKKIQVEVSYVIGKPDPLSVNIETFGTERTSQKNIKRRAKEILNLSVDGIIDTLHLFQPIYRKASVGEFFGRDIFPWE